MNELHDTKTGQFAEKEREQLDKAGTVRIKSNGAGQESDWNAPKWLVDVCEALGRLELADTPEKAALVRSEAMIAIDAEILDRGLEPAIKTEGLSFSAALELAKKGMAIQREGWNGKDLLVRAQYPDAHSKMTLPYLYIEYPDGQRCPWLASQTDMMAEDWRAL